MKKILTIISITVLLLTRTLSFATAQSLVPPSAPETPTNVETAPSSPETPSLSDTTVADNQTENSPTDTDQSTQSSSPETVQAPPETENTPNIADNTSGGNVGDTTITTQDATLTATVVTDANTNAATEGSVAIGNSENTLDLTNQGNGADSTNTIDTTNNTIQDTEQTNNIVVSNTLDTGTSTGENTSSANVGNTTIQTGDTNTTGTVVASVNTNLDGVNYSELNLNDYSGDIVLDFDDGTNLGMAAQNSNNGTNSQNDIQINQITNENSFQQNDATVENNLILDSNSGNNESSLNTGGDTMIATGDANVEANALTFANNNLAGNVTLGVVNIYGTLTGDIILPEEMMATDGTNLTADTTGNGSLSNNSSTVQVNNANITNEIVLAAETGDNQTNANTGGDNSIKTGEASADLQVVNIANNNISGGTWWLVIINEAGEWLGQLFGAGEGNTFAASPQAGITLGKSGDINMSNSGNGADSNNNVNANQENTSQTEQTNSAQITNNLNLSANTGGNKANKNTGGDNTIKTGDAKIIANIINFVNNNVSSSGKLVVTVVNVFGKWVGNFITPGYNKPEIADNTTPDDTSEPEEISDESYAEEPEDTTSEEPEEEEVADETIEEPVQEEKHFSSIVLGQNQTVQDSQTPEVAGDQASQPAKKNLQLNLAWLILITPLFATRYLKHKFFA